MYLFLCNDSQLEFGFWNDINSKISTENVEQFKKKTF